MSEVPLCPPRAIGERGDQQPPDTRGLSLCSESTLEMIWWTGLAPWEFEFHHPGSLISTFLAAARHARNVIVLRERCQLLVEVVQPVPAVRYSSRFKNNCFAEL